MDFFGKVADQFRGLFQNQKSTVTNTNNTLISSNEVSDSVIIATKPTLTSKVPNLNLNLDLKRKPKLIRLNESTKPNSPNEQENNSTNNFDYQQVMSPYSNAHGHIHSHSHFNGVNQPNVTSYGSLYQHHFQGNQRSFDHYTNQSSSSSSNSFILTPSSASFRAADNCISDAIDIRSFSAINTPDSPVNFRRQHSLNVNQRVQASSRLQLDLRSQKNSPLYAKQSASTDLIDKHSLSPRPRPKDLSLSNSQDNMLKGYQCPSSRFDVDHQHTNSGHCQPRPGGLFSNNLNSKPNSGSKVCSSSHSAIYYPKRIELSRNSSSLNIDRKKYENLKENDFKILSQLGSGSFGQVDKMLHKPSNTELAVKKMRRSGNIDDNRHVQRDLELLQKCNYIHVVQCYGYFILETEVWIFMELMSTCFDHLIKKLSERNETFPERIIGKVSVATVDTLDYLKEKHNVIHRDIKPSNILINNQGVIKLCDFGISGKLVESKAHTRSVGSTAYMAPERIEPPPDGTYDIRSDIWSLGITLIEIATGQFPYKNWNTDFEILSKVIQEAPPTLPDDGNFSENFKLFINACLTKNFNNRPKYKGLMTFAFYKHYKKASVDVAEWFKHVYCDDISTKNNNSISTNNTNSKSNINCSPDLNQKRGGADTTSHSSSASSLASNSTIK